MPGGEGLLQPRPRLFRQLGRLQTVDFQPHREHLRKQFGRGVKLKARGSSLGVRQPEIAELLAIDPDRHAHGGCKSALSELGPLIG